MGSLQPRARKTKNRTRFLLPSLFLMVVFLSQHHLAASHYPTQSTTIANQIILFIFHKNPGTQ